MKELYADGGVIGRNPSKLGGTWAFRVLDNRKVVDEQVGTITPEAAKMPAITNNLTEMLAVVRGLASLPEDWVGTVFSDSQITLGRIFEGWKWTGIPLWLHHEYQAARKRLIHWDYIKYVRLDGHPTVAQLVEGKGKRGGPVSEMNVWCDKACGYAAKAFLDEAKL